MAKIDQLVKVYRKIRDAKSALSAEFDKQTKELDDQLNIIKHALLDHCKETGEEGGRTEYGTFSRVVRSKMWASDWEAMGKFIIEHKAVDLLEKRIQQTNMRTFIEANPDIHPPGLEIENTYDIVVRKPNK